MSSLISGSVPGASGRLWISYVMSPADSRSARTSRMLKLCDNTIRRLLLGIRAAVISEHATTKNLMLLVEF